MVDAFDNIFAEVGNHCRAYRLVFVLVHNADYTQIHYFRFFYGTQNAEYAPGRQSSTGFLHRFGNGREHDGKRNKIFIAVQNDGNVFYVNNHFEILNDTAFHFFRKRYRAVDVVVCFVPNGENFVGVLFKKFVGVGCLAEMQIVTLHHVVAHRFYPWFQPVGSGKFVFQPIHVLAVTAVFNELLVVVEIVLFLEGGKLVEALYQQTFPFQVGKAQRSHNFRHSLLFCPIFHRFKQGVCHLLVVYAVKPCETHSVLVPLAVGGTLQNAGNASHHFAVAVGVEVHRLCLIVVHVVFAENLLFVCVERRHKISVALVKFKRKVQKLPLLFFCNYLFYLYHVSPLRIYAMCACALDFVYTLYNQKGKK